MLKLLQIAAVLGMSWGYNMGSREIGAGVHEE